MMDLSLWLPFGYAIGRSLINEGLDLNDWARVVRKCDLSRDNVD